MLFHVHGSVKEAEPHAARARFLPGRVTTCRQVSWHARNFKFELVDLARRCAILLLN